MKAAFVVDDVKVVREVPDLQTPSGPMRSNNIAEYQALILLLRHLRERDEKDRKRRAYRICGDSQLVIRQMRGEYRVTKPHLARLHSEASDLSAQLDVEFRWVPREKNLAGLLLERP
jgi:ribonuclease HI